MDIYITKDGDTLDMICFRAYESLDSEVFGKFLRANSHLLGVDILKGGKSVNLPKIEVKKDDEVRYLWE